jgi:hypothetical protein
MKYSFAVLLLQLLDQNDTPFDLAYAQQVFTAAGRGTRNLVDYFLDVSHGHADLSDSAVFDWLRVGYTADDLAVYTQQTKDDEIKRLNDENATLPATQQRSAEKIEQVAAEVAHNARRAKIKAWVYETAAAALLRLLQRGCAPIQPRQSREEFHRPHGCGPRGRSWSGSDAFSARGF